MSAVFKYPAPRNFDELQENFRDLSNQVLIKNTLESLNNISLITTQTAGSTYSPNEANMLNNIKADLTAIKNLLNSLLNNLKNG